MTRALGSSWPFSAPCRAQVGSAWCRLCQDSPKDAMASQATLRDLSRTSNSSLPKVWQIELIDQVTWCSSAIADQAGPEEGGQRAVPGHPPQPADQRGEQQRDRHQRREPARPRALIRRSASRSGENFSCEVLLGSNSQPMCAYTRPLVSAFQSSP